MAMIEESGISEKIADNVKVVTKTLKEKLPQKTYSTYTKFNLETEQIYVGRTRDYYMRAARRAFGEVY